MDGSGQIAIRFLPGGAANVWVIALVAGSGQIAIRYHPGEREKLELGLQRLAPCNWQADFACGVMAPTTGSVQIAITNLNAKPRNPKLPLIT